MKKFSFNFVLAMLAYLIITTYVSQAQAIPVITVQMPILADTLPRDVFAEFEANYNVDVVLESSLTELYLTSPADNVQDHLTELQQYAQSADVLFVNDSTLSMAGIQSGFLLNLNSLALADPNISISDYHAVAWQSYEWEGQLWALPMAFDTVILAYNPSVFDTANLPYPSVNWTLNDYVDAIRTLTQTDAEGNIIRVGYEQSAYDSYLLSALAQVTLADTSQFPVIPNFNAPDLLQTMTTWKTLVNEGAVGQASDSMANTVDTMTVISSSGLVNTNVNVALLPNGQAAVSVGGLAISAGTNYPEIAYQLAQYITESQVLYDALSYTYPAKQSLLSRDNLPSYIQTQMTDIITVAQPANTMRYRPYLDLALISDTNIANALLLAQQQASADLQTAVELGQNTSILVEGAIVSGDGITLNFAVMTGIAPLPNQPEWERVASDFVAQLPELADVNIEASFGQSLVDFSNNYDCYITSSNPISMIDSSLVLPIEPLIRQDIDFNSDDFMAGTLQAVQSNGMIIGYPISLQPRLLQVDSVQMGNLGVFLEGNQWTLNQFVDMASQWQQTNGRPIYSISQSIDLMTLMTAYGGIPIDNNTSSPMLNFTSAETINAIQQVKNLYDAGYISYSELNAPPSMGNSSSTPLQTVIFNTNLSSQLVPNAHLLHYPSGADYIPVVYRLAVGFIGNQTQYPELCYQWLKTIAQETSLFQSMPTQQSVLDNPNTHAILGNERTELYFSYRDLLQDSQTVRVQQMNPVGSSDEFVLQYLFNIVMDAYMLNNADLESSLAQAQSNAEAYLQCRATGASVRDCAVSIVPQIENVLR